MPAGLLVYFVNEDVGQLDHTVVMGTSVPVINTRHCGWADNNCMCDNSLLNCEFIEEVSDVSRACSKYD